MRFLHASWKVAVPAALLLALLSVPAPSGAQLAPQGPQFQVNPLAPLANEAFASVASDAAGSFVVVWRQVLPAVDAYGIYARLYDALGNPVSGQIQVHQQPASVATETAVAMDEEGNFVVAWTSSPNPGDPEAPPRVVARWFDRTGAPQSGEIVVGDGSLPDVAMRSPGRIAVVVWQKVVDGRSFVFLRGFSADGVPREPETQVSEEPSASPVYPQVDVGPTGGVAVVWQEDDPGDSIAVATVKLRLLFGEPEAGPIEVAGQAEVQDRPDVVLGNGDDVFVVWRRANGIFGRLYDQLGEPLTGDRKLDSGAPQFSSVAENPRVAVDGTGTFLAVWSNRVGPAAQVQDIYGRLVNRAGLVLGNEVRLTSTPSGGDDQLRPDVAGQPNGFVVIREQRFDKVLGQRLVKIPGAVRFQVSEISRREGDGSAVFAVVERGGEAGAVSVSYRTESGTAVAGEDFVATAGTLHWADGNSAPQTIGVFLIDDTVQENARETFSIVLESPTGGATVGEPSRVTITLSDNDGLPIALGDVIEAAAEDADQGFLTDPDVAMDPAAASGRFALVWTDRPLTVLPVVRGRLWLGEGTLLTPVFDVGAGVTPAVLWTSQGLTVVWDGAQDRIEGRRLTEGGSPQGGAFPISDRSEESRRPAIAGNSRGDAVVVWEGIDPAEQDRFGVDILARRLNAAGQPVGGEFAVGSSRSGLQLNPDVAVAPDGSFVVVWQGRSTRTFTTEIFARRFSREGVALGAEFQVNTTTAGEQTRPSVAVDPSGSFFVVWDSVSSDGTEDVFGQLFDAQGRKIGRDFQINTFTLGRQFEPRVESQLLGGYVVVWTSGVDSPPENPGQDGDLLGVFGQRYDSRGRPVGAELQANTDPVGNQESPAVSTGRGGTFVVAWRTRLANLDTRIEAQRFSSASICQPTPTTLCLDNGRFQVRASWDTGFVSGQGKAVGLSNETGFFWFFSPENVEMIVKALDGCGVNQRFWVFSGGLTDVEVELEVTDTSTGAVRTYRNPQGTAFLPIQDTSAFPTCDVPGPGDPLPPIPEPTACGGEPAAIALAGGRFRVDVEWATSDGTTGRGQGVQLTLDTGYFCFFSPDNVEIVVKVLDGCPVNRRFWVFSGGLTDVEVRMTVTDTFRGETRVYTNPRGRAFQPIQDTSAFATCQ